MSRILFAWELGANYGHLVASLRVAQALRERRHKVIFAVRDTRAAAELLTPAGFAFVQAPLAIQKARLYRPPGNFSEVLLGEGYADRLGLLGMVRAWCSLIQLIRPAVIMADYAPTAMIAGRSMELPCIAMTNGFAVPPHSSPLPSIRLWEEIPAARLDQADNAVNASIAEVMKTVGSKTTSTLIDLSQNALLYIFPELDPFGPREEVNYIGPIFAIPGAKTTAWPKDSKRKILAYLRPNMAGFPELMAALSEIDAHKICVIPGLRREQVSRLSNDQLRISTTPLAFESLLSSADAFVNYGSSGAVSQALLAGVPLLLAPLYVEQYLTAKRAEAIGAAVVVETNRRREDFDQALTKVLEESAHCLKALAFAAKHADFDPRQAIDRAVLAIELAIDKNQASGRVMNS